jgi:hypothetical protein
MHHYLRISVSKSNVTTPSQWIDVPVNGNKIHEEAPEGFAMAGRF